MDDEEKEDYLLRLPTFMDVSVLLDHNDLTGSDDWGIEKFNGWNEFNYRGKTVYKLFKNLRQEIKKSQPNLWSSYKVAVSEEFRQFLLKPLSPNSMSTIKKPHQPEESSSSENKNNRCNNLTSKVFSSQKPEKRKFEESTKVHRQKKTPKTTSGTNVDRKKPAHLLSSEDSELSDSNPSYSASVNNMCELDNTRVNGQVSDSTRDRPSTSRLHHGNTNVEVGSINSQIDDSESSSVNEEGSETEQIDRDVHTNASGNSKKFQRAAVDFKSQESDTSSEKVCREHIFTQSDEEEVSKFSFLLDDDIVKNNHVWILQCPSSMDCSSLIGQKLDLNGNCKLDIGQRSYEAFSYKSHDSRVATLAVPSHRNQLELKRLPIAGNIIVEEFLDITSDSSYSIKEAPQHVEFPNNLCTRHPLFGKNFKKPLQMAKKVDQISRKKKLSLSSDDLNEVNETLESDASYEAPKRKKKKRKHETAEFNDSNLNEVNETLERDASYEAPKRKKKKRKRETAEFNDSSSAISESALNSSFGSPKKKKIKQESREEH